MESVTFGRSWTLQLSHYTNSWTHYSTECWLAIGRGRKPNVLQRSHTRQLQNSMYLFFSRSLVPCPFWEIPQSQVPRSLVSGPFWGHPSPGWGYHFQPGQDGVPPRDRTAERTLAMLREVCLLCSRRKTFLFLTGFLFWWTKCLLFCSTSKPEFCIAK